MLTDRTPLLSAAIQDQPPPGDLQAYRQASNVPGPDQGGTSVLSSTRPTATVPILRSSLASSYEPRLRNFSSTVKSYSSSQPFPSGYAISGAATGSPNQSRWQWTAAGTFDSQSFVNSPSNMNATSTIQMNTCFPSALTGSLGTLVIDCTDRHCDVQTSFGTGKMKFSPSKDKLVNQKLPQTVQAVRVLEDSL